MDDATKEYTKVLAWFGLRASSETLKRVSEATHSHPPHPPSYITNCNIFPIRTQFLAPTGLEGDRHGRDAANGGTTTSARSQPCWKGRSKSQTGGKYMRTYVTIIA
jgi:hypothetical protein